MFRSQMSYSLCFYTNYSFKALYMYQNWLYYVSATFDYNNVLHSSKP